VGDDRPVNLLVAGELNPDIFVIGDDLVPEFGQTEKVVSAIRLEVGSSSAIMACGAARLGLAVAFVGVVGDDAIGRYMLGELADRGIDTVHCTVDPAIPTGATLVLTRGQDRANLTAVGTIDRLRGSDVPDELLDRVRHLHLGSTGLVGAKRAGLPELLARAKAHGATTSVDPNGDPEGRWKGTDEMLAIADLFLPNLEEARRISSQHDAEDAARELARRGDVARGNGSPIIVAVKLGPDGAIAVQGGRVVRQVARRVSVQDTTGAGDSFDAGFVAAWISGWPLEEALALGVACGTLSTQAIGGTASQPTLEEAAGEMRTLLAI
jgi:sugar/nucleoside kinase (ribokinase family)